MENIKRQELEDRRFALMTKIAPTVVENVMRAIPLSDICRIKEEDNPEWVRGTALIVNKMVKELLPRQETVQDSLRPSSIIIPSMPHLEWAPENLTGHGGTEVDGRWYYTWEQAMAAAKELGDGWRLPTVEEFEQLCKAGSTWVGNGPDGIAGRWFGGNHDTDHDGSIFFPAAGSLRPAAGYRDYSSGALYDVGAWGGSWSSSPAASGSANASYLIFRATYVYPLVSNHRAYGLPVRCVKDL